MHDGQNDRDLQLNGMWFAVRDNFLPTGLRRHTGGTLTADAFLRMCELFDGQNEAAVMASLERQGLVMNVFGHAGNYRLALLSVAERDEIRASGVTMTLADLRAGSLDCDGDRRRDEHDRPEHRVTRRTWLRLHLRRA